MCDLFAILISLVYTFLLLQPSLQLKGLRKMKNYIDLSSFLSSDEVALPIFRLCIRTLVGIVSLLVTLETLHIFDISCVPRIDISWFRRLKSI